MYRVHQKSSVCRKMDFDDDEERRIKEGAEALVNLSRIKTPYNNNNNDSSSYNYEDVKRCKKNIDDVVNGIINGKPSQFRPRLLRKKRDVKRLTNNNNLNNNNIIVQADDEWVKHRRELEKTGNR